MTAVRAVVGLLYFAACPAGAARGDVPAVITNPTAQGRAELLRVVGEALNGAPLTIADDALTRASTLVIERARPRGPDGIPMTGRDRGRPERFQLVKNGSRCVLVHERTGQRFPLASATCAPK
ncbi:MAG: hypothetical protein DMF81_26410 [Acidobacteria bacterium]|nr:MAG: hypothetical protein DMF81_26410 [Acidobacteriota bacterium]